jgi:hypothetical protein
MSSEKRLVGWSEPSKLATDGQFFLARTSPQSSDGLLRKCIGEDSISIPGLTKSTYRLFLGLPNLDAKCITGQ